jgi:hypothetical protein
MDQRQVRRRFRRIASKVWNRAAIVPNSSPNTRLCVIFAMRQVQRIGQIISGYRVPGGVMRNSNTQSSWDFRLQSQRNYLKREIPKRRPALPANREMNDDGRNGDKWTIIDFSRPIRSGLLEK